MKILEKYYLREIGLTLVASILFFLSFPNAIVPEGVQGLGMIALAPIFFVLAKIYNVKIAFRLGLLFGLLYTLTSYYWLARFREFSTWTIAGVSLAYTVEYSILFVLIYYAYNAYSRTHYFSRPLAIAIVWTGYEYIKSTGFLGFPWTLLAHTFHNVDPIIQIARLTGTWGLSFMIAYANTFITECVLHYSTAKPYEYIHRTTKEATSAHNIKVHGSILIVLFVCSMGYGYMSLYKAPSSPPAHKISMLLVQQNFDSWANIPSRDSLQKIISLTDDALQQNTDMPPPQLIVWSETTLSVPYQIEESPYAKEFYSTTPNDESFLEFIKRIDTPLITGTPWYDFYNDGAYNASVLINPNGKVENRYGKNQLVPFAELLPLYNVEFVRTLIKKYIGLGGTWMPSNKFNTLEWSFDNAPQSSDDIPFFEGTLKIGTPICFEDSFSYITRNFRLQGAQILLNLTNVSWSKTKVAQMQQYVSAKFRSIETGITLVRSTNSGVTSVIDPWGKTLDSIPMFEANTMLTTVPIYELDTLFLFWGDFIGILCATIGTIYCTLLVVKRRKTI